MNRRFAALLLLLACCAFLSGCAVTSSPVRVTGGAATVVPLARNPFGAPFRGIGDPAD